MTMNLENIYIRLIALGDDPRDDHMVELKAHIDTPDDQAGMLTAFRHAANSLGIEAGVICSHKAHGGLLGDHYFLELISASQQAMRHSRQCVGCRFDMSGCMLRLGLWLLIMLRPSTHWKVSVLVMVSSHRNCWTH